MLRAFLLLPALKKKRPQDIYLKQNKKTPKNPYPHNQTFKHVK